jgi:hypothetical protein
MKCKYCYSRSMCDSVESILQESEETSGTAHRHAQLATANIKAFALLCLPHRHPLYLAFLLVDFDLCFLFLHLRANKVEQLQQPFAN